MGAGPGRRSAVLFLAPAGGRGPLPLGARGGDALRRVEGRGTRATLSWCISIEKWMAPSSNR